MLGGDFEGVDLTFGFGFINEFVKCAAAAGEVDMDALMEAARVDGNERLPAGFAAGNDPGLIAATPKDVLKQLG